MMFGCVSSGIARTTGITDNDSAVEFTISWVIRINANSRVSCIWERRTENSGHVVTADSSKRGDGGRGACERRDCGQRGDPVEANRRGRYRHVSEGLRRAAPVGVGRWNPACSSDQCNAQRAADGVGLGASESGVAAVGRQNGRPQVVRFATNGMLKLMLAAGINREAANRQWHGRDNLGPCSLYA